MIEFIETKNQDEIKSILFDKEMWDRISEDGQEKPDEFPLDGMTWVKVLADNKFVGLILLHHVNLTTIQVHFNILKEFRGKYAYQIGKKMIEVYVGMPERINKLICTIPCSYPDVYNFTLKFGFKAEGIRRGSTYRDGHFIDEYCLGLTKKEGELWVQQQQ